MIARLALAAAVALLAFGAVGQAGSVFESSKLGPTIVLQGGALQSPKIAPTIVLQGGALQSPKIAPTIVLQGLAFQSSKIVAYIVLMKSPPPGGVIPRAPLTHW